MGTTPGCCNCLSDSKVVFCSLTFRLGSVTQQTSLCKLEQMKGRFSCGLPNLLLLLWMGPAWLL